MRILHINSYYSTTKLYKNFYEEQVRQGLDLDVYVPVSGRYAQSGFDFGPYTTVAQTHREFERLFFHIKHGKTFRDIKARYDFTDYSLTHAHSLFSNGYISLQIRREFGIPYVVAVRDTDVNIFFKKMPHLRRLGIEVLKEASQLIFLSQAYQDAVIGEYVPEALRPAALRKSQVIPNGIDEFWFRNLATPKNKPEKNKLNLLQVGDISRRKNVSASVEACKILIDQSYEIKLDLVGRIKDEKIFKRISGYDYVNYLGYRTKEELLEIYLANDIFVLPSRTETFGLVYAEAMSQGLPLIYTRGQGFDTQFKGGTVGYAVSRDDPKDIADRILEILKNYTDISEKCILSVDRFRWNKIVSTYKEIYEKV